MKIPVLCSKHTKLVFQAKYVNYARMREFFRYYWRVIKTAFTESWDWSQTILSLILFGVSVYASYDKNAQAMLEVASSWKFLACLFGSVVCSRLIYAPFQIHKQQIADNAGAQKLAFEQKRINDIAEATLKVKEDELDMQQLRHAHQRMHELGIPGAAIRTSARKRHTPRDDEIA